MKNNKQLIAAIIVAVGLIFGGIILQTSGQTISTLPVFKLSGTTMTPRVNTWSFQVPQLSNCNTIDTDASGNFACGTDEGGAGSGITSINGLTTTTQVFATGSSTGIGLTVGSSGATHTFTPTVSAGYIIPLSASTTQWNSLFNASSSWNTAFGWGNHATAGYHTSSSLSAVSPLNYNSVTGAFSVTSSYAIPLSASSTQWNTAFNWGNHATAGYLTAESDPQVGAVTNNKWCIGDGSAVQCNQDAPTGEAFTTTSINGTLSTAFTFATSTANNLTISIATSSNTITFNPGVASGYGIPLSASTTQWNTAFNWGNHALAGYLTAVGSDSTWTQHNSYPAGCGAGEFVSAIGDTLTCSVPSGSGGGDGWWRSSGGNITPTTTDYAVSVGSTTNYGPLSVFSTSTGAHILTVSDNGRLGIGTTTPGSVLSVVGASTFNGSTTINGLVYGWPVNHTSSGYLKNNGTGGLSWETVTPGSSFTTTSINGVVSTAFTFATSTAGNISLSITTSSNTVTFNPSVNTGYGIPLSASTTQWNGLFNASSSWNTAYGWGNHATAGYHSSSSLSAVSPLNYNSVTGSFSVTSSYAIPLSASSTQWNTAFNWGNHASAGYLTSVGSDSTWTQHNSYPAACAAGNFVTAIGDTLTCSVPVDAPSYNYWGVSSNNLYASSTSYNLALGTTTANGMLSVRVTENIRPLQFASSSGSDMLIMDTTGRIGIGTTTPNAMLTLKSFSNIDVLNIASSTGSSLLSLKSNGYLGISSSTPSSMLAVNGTSTMAGLIVDNGVTGTTTVTIGAVGNPGCIKMRAANNGGWTYFVTATSGAGFTTTTAGACGD